MSMVGVGKINIFITVLTMVRLNFGDGALVRRLMKAVLIRGI